MLSRRGFLVRVGGLLTAAFVKSVRSPESRKRRPLLKRSPAVALTLRWYDISNGLLLTVGASMLEGH